MPLFSFFLRLVHFLRGQGKYQRDLLRVLVRLICGRGGLIQAGSVYQNIGYPTESFKVKETYFKSDDFIFMFSFEVVKSSHFPMMVLTEVEVLSKTVV